MKKILAALVMSLAISASCFAEGASKNFAAEEKAADALINSLTGTTVTYDQVSKSFSDGLKKNLPAEAFEPLKKRIKDQVGTVKETNFVAYEKAYNLQNGYTNVEILQYIGIINKEKLARFIVIFTLENNTPKIADIRVVPVQVTQQAPAQK